MPGWLNAAGFFVVFDWGGDNSTVCTNFGFGQTLTLSPGQILVFNIDNTRPPGGLGRTIGFWKNGSSCTGGNQFPTLDQNLPVTLGILTLQGSTVLPPGPPKSPTARWPVTFLSKSDGKTGKKLASDPAYNMAAQLLAAVLNYHAGDIPLCGFRQCSASTQHRRYS